ncbi:hypothetical protein [Paludisphaera soli]|uniref:hypothetical protein n=1 Tax=Paludisphaera soli TaxID=2712865 RepID=UPI0013EAB420|nr:hypothetical protein [Paludisphaera soli]
METIWTGRLVGAFCGYGRGRVYKLSDDSVWVQEDATDEPGYLEGAEARLLTRRGSGIIHLLVEGAMARVRVGLVETRVRKAV